MMLHRQKTAFFKQEAVAGAGGRRGAYLIQFLKKPTRYLIIFFNCL